MIKAVHPSSGRVSSLVVVFHKQIYVPTLHAIEDSFITVSPIHVTTRKLYSTACDAVCSERRNRVNVHGGLFNYLR